MCEVRVSACEARLWHDPKHDRTSKGRCRVGVPARCAPNPGISSGAPDGRSCPLRACRSGRYPISASPKYAGNLGCGRGSPLARCGSIGNSCDDQAGFRSTTGLSACAQPARSMVRVAQDRCSTRCCRSCHRGHGPSCGDKWPLLSDGYPYRIGTHDDHSDGTTPPLGVRDGQIDLDLARFTETVTSPYGEYGPPHTGSAHQSWQQLFGNLDGTDFGAEAVFREMLCGCPSSDECSVIAVGSVRAIHRAGRRRPSQGCAPPSSAACSTGASVPARAAIGGY